MLYCNVWLLKPSHACMITCKDHFQMMELSVVATLGWSIIMVCENSTLTFFALQFNQFNWSSILIQWPSSKFRDLVMFVIHCFWIIFGKWCHFINKQLSSAGTSAVIGFSLSKYIKRECKHERNLICNWWKQYVNHRFCSPLVYDLRVYKFRKGLSKLVFAIVPSN